MALLYKPSKWAIVNDEPSLTEQEHKDSCDINKMIRAIERGQQVRGGREQQYGHDDLTMDALQHRILKQQTEESLTELFENNELSEEDIQKLPQAVIQKFKIRKKAAQTNDDNKKTNDDKKAAEDDTSKTSKTASIEPKAQT